MYPLLRPTIFTLSLLILSAVASPRDVYGDEITDWVDQQLPGLVKLYREFHQTPELSFHEVETAKRTAGELEKAGYQVTTGLGGHGVVGLLKNGPGPTVMWRTDLDALPVAEMTGLEYASKVKVKNDQGAEVGVMHACGHDIHIANFIGLARFLAENRKLWSGTALFIGQPAEERGAGAKAMLADGLFEKHPKPDYALALHVDASLAAGTVGYRAGYAMANVDSVDIVCKGRGGHGSAPHTTIDPILMAAHLVVDLQSIVSREISPLDPAVVTVGSIHGGSKHNIIGDDCRLQLTVRSYTDKVRTHLLSAIKRKALAAAAAAGAPEPEIKIDTREFTPAVYNDPKLTGHVVDVLKKRIGEKQVQEVEQTMGGEDFSRYGLAGVPIFMYRLGAVEAERLAQYTQAGRPAPSLHSPIFYPDPEPTLRCGLETSAAAMLDLLRPKQP